MADAPVTPTAAPTNLTPATNTVKPKAGFSPNAPTKNWFPDTPAAPSFSDAKSKAPAADTPKVNADPVTPGSKDKAVVPDEGTKPKEIKPDEQTGERKFKVKIDGREVEVSETELLRGYSHAQVANQRLQQAALMQKKNEHMLQMIKDNPAKVLSDPAIGLDIKKFAIDYLAQTIQDEQNPDKAALRQAQEKLEAFEQERAARDELQKQTEFQQQTQAMSAQYARDIDNGFEASPNLPKTESTYNRVIYWLDIAGKQALAQGRNLDSAAVIKQIMPIVENELKDWTKQLYAKASPEQLMDYFGEDIAKKIRMQDIKRLKNPIANNEVVKAAKKTSKKESPKKQNMNDFFANLQNKK